MSGAIVDDRDRGWFHIDNYVVDAYLPLVGLTAFALYAYIVRNVNRDRGFAWPSYTKMQRDLGIGRNQVAASIKTLVQYGLMRVEKGDGAAVNHYYILTPPSLAEKLVSEENQSRSETETSFQEKPKLVSQRDSIKTELKRPNDKEGILTRESEINSPVRARTREAAGFSPVNFSPAHPQLTQTEIAADAAECGTTAAMFAGYIPQWADSRKTQGRTSSDWRADLRKFVRAAVEIAARGATGQQSGGARASPPPFAARDIQTSRESIETVLAAKKEFLDGRREFSRGNDGTERRLSTRVRADAGDDGGVAETPRRP